MSQILPASSSSGFQPLFNAALSTYQAKTKTDLLAHTLAAQLRNCNSPTAILAVLQDLVQKFDQRRNSNEKLTKCLNTTVNVLYALCPSLGAGVSLVNLQWFIFIRDLRSDFHLAGIPTCQSSLYRDWCPSLGVYLLLPLLTAIVTPGSIRRPRMSMRVKKCLSNSSSESKTS
jgi:hypothetical protein